MAEFSTKRVVAIAALAGALVGGAVATGVAVAATSGSSDIPVGSRGAGSELATAAVVRTTLRDTVQVGGSIGYQGSFTVTVPAGTSAQQIAQAQQAVTMDQQTLSADERTESDASESDNQSIGAAQANLSTAESTLGADQAQKAKACAGDAASTVACIADAQKVSQDQSQLTQAQQQLAAARSSAAGDYNQNRAKVAADETLLQGDEASLTSLQATAANPATTYTFLPQVGQVIDEDQRVYSLSNVEVPLLYGAIAAYRAFYVGMSDGADVGELTHDLISIGYGDGLAESNHYSSATATAVEAWQQALGLPATGGILLGGVVFEPGPIRVTSVTPSVGQSVGAANGGGGGATVLTATSTTPDVTVDLAVSEEYLVKPGDSVSIVLPDGTSTVGGRIETVGTVATCAAGGGTGTASGTPGGSGSSPCSSAGSGSNSSPTVTVTITLDRTPLLATLDQAPVNVDITTERAANVLAAPVNALLALAGGGFGVDVVTGSTSRLAGVTTGLYDSTLVQISGPGITAGTRVEVPSS